MKKIGIISNLFPPEIRGGAEKIAFYQAKILQQAGYDVFAVSTHNKLGSRKETVEGILVYRYFPLNFFHYLNDYKYNIIYRALWRFVDTFNVFSAVALFLTLKKERPDIVFTHNMVGFGLLSPLVFKILKIKHIHTIHDAQLVKPSGLLTTGNDTLSVFEKVYHIITQFLFSYVNWVISPSHALLDVHNRFNMFPNAEQTVMTNPIVLNIANSSKVKNKKCKLLFVGQIESHKGILELLDAVSNLNHQLDDSIELHVIGTGSILRTIKSKYKKDQNIYFYGRLEKSDIIKFLDECTYLVVPSINFENSPTVIFEAFSRGLPVIGHKIGGIPELIKNEERGFTYKQSKLKRVLEEAYFLSPQLYTEMSQNCLDYMKKNTAEQYLKRVKWILETIT